jgi:hypothetical protein
LIVRARPADGGYELTREVKFSGPDAGLLREDDR